MIGYFIYGDIDTRNYEGIVVSEDEVDSAPERSYEEITIAGRNGTFLLDGNRFENVIHSYDILVYDDYVDNLIQLRNDILSKIGYQVLRDSFNPDEKYLARVYTQVTPKQKVHRDAGSMHIEFSRKPQRFLVSGDSPYDFVSNYQILLDENSESLANEDGEEIEGGVTLSDVIVNPTRFEAKPLIKIRGSGTVGIGSQLITVTDIPDSETVYIDCESMEIYTLAGGIASGASSHVSFNGNDFPIIPVGSSGFSKTMDMVEIIPRWWRI